MASDRHGEPFTPSEEDARAERLARLYAEYVDRINAGESIDPRRVLAEQPDLGPTLLDELGALEEIDFGVDIDPVLGTLGDYRLLREVGRGGMGVVYEAWQNSVDRRVALKVLPSGITGDSRRLNRFLREAKIAASLQHPSIVPVHDLGVEEHSPYFSMDFVEGETLAQVMSRYRREADKSPLDAVEIDLDYCLRFARCFADVADGLQYAHQKGVIHRDIKPSNLILDQHGSLRILDFGLARMEGQESLTQTGELMGTPLYMSPEQASVRSIRVDHRTDIYSLGTTLYETLLWRPPFRGKNHQDTLDRIISDDPVPPRKLRSRIPPDLETIVLKCLRKEPDDRYGTAEAMAQDLRRFVRGDPIEARPLARWEKLAHQARRYRRRIAVGGIFFILVTTVAILWIVQLDNTRQRLLREYEPRIRGALELMQHGRMTIRVGTRMATFERIDPVRLLEGIHAATRGDTAVEDAIAILDAIADGLPDRPEAYYYRARGHFLNGDVAAALEDIRLALDRGQPDFVPATLLKIAILRSEQQDEEADVEHQRAKGGAEDHWAADLLRAHEAMEKREWIAAASTFGDLLKLEQGDGEPLYAGSTAELLIGRGIAYLEAEKYIAASDSFSRVCHVWPTSIEPVLLLAETYYLMKEPHEAARVFEEFYDPTAFRDEAALGIAFLHYYLNDFEKGLAWADKIEERLLREPMQMVFLILLQRNTMAIRIGERLIKDYPNHSRVHTFLGWGAHEARYSQQYSQMWFQKAVDLDPGDVHAQLSLGIDTIWYWELDRAIHHLKQSIEISEWSLVYVNLAIAWYLKGNTERARVHYEKGYELSAMRAHQEHLFAGALQESYGQFEAREGNLRDALRLWTEGLALSPRSFGIHDGITRALAEDFEGKRAATSRLIEALSQLMTEERSSPLLWKTRAVSRLSEEASRRDLEGARRDAESAVEKTARKDASMLAVLARVQAEQRDHAAAVVTLEEALALPGSDPSLEIELTRQRLLYPGIASYRTARAFLEGIEREELVGEDATWSYFKGKHEPPAEWASPDFDDREWLRGRGGFGHGLHHSYRTWLGDLIGSYRTVYLRVPFEITNLHAYRRVSLYVRAEDGFVAHINGTEVGRARAGPTGTVITHDGTARMPSRGRTAFVVRINSDRLVAGRNWLAIQALTYPVPGYPHGFFIDALLVGEKGDARDGREVLQRIDGGSGTHDSDHLRLYLEGVLARSDGRLDEARAAFENLVAVDPTSLEPRLQLVECLRTEGEPERALEALRPLFAREGAITERCWNLWMELRYVDLEEHPEEILADWPQDPADAVEHGIAADLLWLTRELARNGNFRINCGAAKDYVDQDRKMWSRDRFYLSGSARGERFGAMEIAATEDDPLYHTERIFGQDGFERPIYRFPVPRGRYRMTLHFAEVFFMHPGQRRFDVQIEGELRIVDYEPQHRHADKQIIHMSVDDGFLDIKFIHDLGRPKISAIEIERLGEL